MWNGKVDDLTNDVIDSSNRETIWIVEINLRTLDWLHFRLVNHFHQPARPRCQVRCSTNDSWGCYLWTPPLSFFFVVPSFRRNCLLEHPYCRSKVALSSGIVVPVSDGQWKGELFTCVDLRSNRTKWIPNDINDFCRATIVLSWRSKRYGENVLCCNTQWKAIAIISRC